MTKKNPMTHAALIETVTGSVRLSTRTKKLYTNAINMFIDYAGADPAGWTGKAVEAWRTHMRDGRRRQPQTVNLYLSGVRYASRRVAEQAGDPTLDFAIYAERMKMTQRVKPVALTLEQARDLVAACDGTRPIDLRDRAMVILGLRTGLRRASIANIKIESLRKNKLTTVVKGDRTIEIFLDDETVMAINNWIACLRVHAITSGPLWRSMRRPDLVRGVTFAANGLTPEGVYTTLAARAKVAKIEHFHPHVMRHTFVSMAVAAGVPTWRIREITGHNSDAMINAYTTDLEAASNPVSSHLPSVHAVAVTPAHAPKHTHKAAKASKS